jgi:hypothetical protein
MRTETGVFRRDHLRALAQRIEVERLERTERRRDPIDAPAV